MKIAERYRENQQAYKRKMAFFGGVVVGVAISLVIFKRANNKEFVEYLISTSRVEGGSNSTTVK